MLSVDQIQDAIRQVMVDCELKQENYEMVSMRSSLYSLGYNEEEADDVIKYCAEHGFNYCIDPIIKFTSISDPKPVSPHYQVCYWGPDQLKSRLRSVR